MANEGISITPEELAGEANNIRRCNNELRNILRDIDNQMGELERTWSSDACDTIMTNFKKLRPKFDAYSEVINSYADFLDKTVQSYQNTEATNVSNASAFD